jgi:hypothetical protein
MPLRQRNAVVVESCPENVLEDLKRDHLLRVLEESNRVVGGRKGAAKRVGMKRTTFVYKMGKFGINRPKFSLTGLGRGGRSMKPDKSYDLARLPKQAPCYPACKE